MAKKKSEPKAETKADSKPAAKKAPAKKPATAAKSGASGGGGGGMPLIDTSHVAESAARMLSAGLNRKNVGGGSKHAESSMFKQLKSGLNKPSSTAMNNLLDKTHGPAGSGSKPGFNPGAKQVGHNQTFGADVNRSGVPRRTSGG